MPIKLVENTGYKYDPVYRFCGWEHAENIRPVKACGAGTIGEFYLACLKAWSVETCSERFRPEWSAANPSIGQCTITAALVHEFFGGEVYSVPLGDGLHHSFNRIGGVFVDLASAQFGSDALPDLTLAEPVDAASLLTGGDKAERCALLRERLLKELAKIVGGTSGILVKIDENAPETP